MARNKSGVFKVVTSCERIVSHRHVIVLIGSVRDRQRGKRVEHINGFPLEWNNPRIIWWLSVVGNRYHRQDRFIVLTTFALSSVLVDKCQQMFEISMQYKHSRLEFHRTALWDALCSDNNAMHKYLYELTRRLHWNTMWLFLLIFNWNQTILLNSRNGFTAGNSLPRPHFPVISEFLSIHSFLHPLVALAPPLIPLTQCSMVQCKWFPQVNHLHHHVSLQLLLKVSPPPLPTLCLLGLYFDQNASTSPSRKSNTIQH